MRHRLYQYSQSGVRMWEADITAVPGVSWSSAGKLAVSTDGRVYHADGYNNQILVYSRDGVYSQSIPTEGRPYGIAIDITNQWLLVGYAGCSPCNVDLYHVNGSFIQHVLQMPDSVYSLAMYNNSRLVVGTNTGLYLYNIEAVLLSLTN